MKRLTLFTLLLCAALLSGCAANRNPLVRAEATKVPGLAMTLHAAAASDSNAETISATLYYRYLDQLMLAPENRTLSVRRDESIELVLLRALLEGPGAESTELKRLFPENVRVLSADGRNGILYVMFNSALLTASPEGEDAAACRALMIQSAVASVTENFPYRGVQLLVYREDNPHADTRVAQSFFMKGGTGVSSPIVRDENVLLTPQHTAERILEAWRSADYEALYAYTSAAYGGVTRPIYSVFAEEADAHGPPRAFSVSAGSVSLDGQSAVLCLTLTFEDASLNAEAYPLRLTRERGLWKIDYQTLLMLMGGNES